MDICSLQENLLSRENAKSSASDFLRCGEAFHNPLDTLSCILISDKLAVHDAGTIRNGGQQKGQCLVP